MDPIVTLTPSGLRDPAASVEGEEAAHIEIDSLSALGPYLWRPVRLAEGFTLGDLVGMVDHRGLPLMEWMLDCSIRPYIRELELAGQLEERPAIEYLRVRRHPQAPTAENEAIGWRLVGYLEGWGVWGEDESGEIYTGPIAVEHVPPAELVGIELRYEPGLTLPAEGDGEGFRGPVAMRLIELLRAVFRTLDAFGSPERRQAARQAMEAEIEDVVSTFDRGDGIQADSVEAYLRKLKEREEDEDAG